jgi:hypothetical protein
MRLVFAFSKFQPSEPAHQVLLAATVAGAFGIKMPLLSSAYMAHPAWSCLMLLKQPTAGDLVFAFANMGDAMQHKRARTATTISSSINVKAFGREWRLSLFILDRHDSSINGQKRQYFQRAIWVKFVDKRS